MKPSEAMRAGARISGQAFRHFRMYNYQNDTYDTYAVGAMALGYGGEEYLEYIDVTPERDVAVHHLTDMFHTNFDQEFHHPLIHLPGTTEPIYDIIVALNDIGRLKREDIADWLESVGL